MNGDHGVLAARCAQRQFDEGLVDRLDELVRKLDISCLGWECRGQPGIDAIRAVLEVGPGRVGKVVDTLLEVDRGFRIDIFPLGIPDLDRVQLHARLGLFQS